MTNNINKTNILSSYNMHSNISLWKHIVNNNVGIEYKFIGSFGFTTRLNGFHRQVIIITTLLNNNYSVR